jgi:hypothetical protein
VIEAAGPKLELHDIQSGVLRPRPTPYAATYILLHIDDRGAAGELLLELPSQARANEREHQAPISAVVLQHPFCKWRAVGGSAANHSVDPRDACHRRIPRIGPSNVTARRSFVSNGVVGLIKKIVVALCVGSKLEGPRSAVVSLSASSLGVLKGP